MLQPQSHSHGAGGKLDKNKTKKRVVDKPRCGLCFKADGLMKRSTCGVWTHPVCVLFTCELTLDDNSGRANNLHSLDKARKNLVCRLCRVEGGACVQCSVKDCFEAFHPYCAYTARQQMLVRMQEEKRVVRNGMGKGSSEVVETNSYELYCNKHKDRHIDLANETTITSSRLPLKNKNNNNSNGSACTPAVNKAKISHNNQKTSLPLKSALFSSIKHRLGIAELVKTNNSSKRVTMRLGSDDEDDEDVDKSRDSTAGLVDTAEKPKQQRLRLQKTGTAVDTTSRKR